MRKGFNMFTALLATMLVIIASLLIFAMIQQERNAKEEVMNVATHHRLETYMQQIRSDAIQEFNFFIRSKIEEYLASDSIDLGSLKVWDKWDNIKRSFVLGYFAGGEAQLTESIAKGLPAFLDRMREALAYEKRYEVKVQGSAEEFKEVLKKLMEVSVEEKNFLEVVECEGKPENCPKGTFYINLKLSKLSDDEYEKLPVIIVRDVVTGAEVRGAILPRNDLKLYVPLRMFKAFAFTRKYLHSDLTNINSASDYGYLSPRIHNELDSMALGICDYGYCMPRTNPYFPPEKRYIEPETCPGSGRKDELKRITGYFRGKSFSYDPSDAESMKKTLIKLVKDRLCELSVQHLQPISQSDFEVLHNTDEGQCYVFFDELRVRAVGAKRIKINEPYIKLLGKIYNEPNNPNICPYKFTLMQNRRLGFWLGFTSSDWEKTLARIAPETCSGFTNRPENPLEWSCQGMRGCCIELDEISFTLRFEEKDKNYKVFKNRKLIYKIKISDLTFVPFNPNYDSGAPQANCALQKAPARQFCNAAGWECVIAYDSFRKKYYGCYPKGA